MKQFYFLFSIFYFLSLISATPVLNFQYDQIQPGETILATVTSQGTFTRQIETTDITFLEGRKPVFFEHDITFYNNTYYLYIYTTRSGNFTIKIKNILFKESDELNSETIQQNFTVQDTTNQTQILSIKPGFIFTTQTPKIELTNKGTSTINATFNKDIISIPPLKTEEIIFIPTKIFSIVEISSYKNFLIPIIYPSANGTFQVKQQLDLKPNPKLLFAELFIGNKSQEIIQLFNFGNESITNISIILDQSFIKAEPIRNISAREVYNLTLNLAPQTPGYFNGNINITYIQYNKKNTLQIPMSLFVLPQGSTQEDFQISEETCEEKNGTSCTTDEICDGKAFFTKNNEYCCIGACQSTAQNENGFGYGWLIAIIIFIALAGGGYYLYKKQKKVKPQTPDEKIKETSEKYSKRIRGGLVNS